VTPFWGSLLRSGIEAQSKSMASHKFYLAHPYILERPENIIAFVICFPPNSYIEILTPSVVVLGVRAFEW
jgi:hypothetical protein